MTTALTTTQTTALANPMPGDQEWRTILSMAGTLVKSGLLPASIKTAEAAAAVILKGRELAIPPMQAFSHIHVIQGRPTCSSELMLAILARGGCAWDWLKDGSTGEAEILFRRKGFREVSGRFTLDEAKKAALLNKDTWKNYPASMLRARAIASGARMIGPDLLAGMSYTPEELGAEVDRDGEPLKAVHATVTVEHAGETVDTTTGEIVGPGPREQPPRQEKPYFRYLKRCAALKAEMGDDPYYRVLTDMGVSHSNEVSEDDTETMTAIVKALEAEKTLAVIDPQPTT
ncbi:MAG: hypothetical protein FJY95_23070 [Candidatus Handelsmanbacteria bacterium]|nr:hypothetical protein [Candidatus Handelsmanbacteria bacterium]